MGYAVPAPGAVTLRVYNTLGRVPRVLVNETQAAGAYRLVWDGRTTSGQEAPTRPAFPSAVVQL